MLFGLASWLPAGAADEASSLLVGSLRDQTGRPVVADVVAYDAAGRPCGHDRSAADGTFVIALERVPSILGVNCPHCAPLRRTLGDERTLAIIVTRYRALETSGPEERDLQALPYIDPGDAVGLAPYVVPFASNGRVGTLSDRGLDHGRGLVFDGGAPTYDPVTGDSGLFAFPGRALNSLQMASASRAFTYGNYAGGGLFALARPSDQRFVVSDEAAGPSGALAADGRFGAWTPALAFSGDEDIVVRRRADLGFSDPFAGGSIRIDLVTAAQQSPNLLFADDRSLNLADVAYATASRRSRTFIDASVVGERGLVLTTPSSPLFDIASSGITTDLRVEYPAPVEVDAGLSLQATGGSYTLHYGGGVGRGAHYDSGLAYLEVKHDGPLSYDAGLSLSRLQIASRSYNTGGATLLAALPSLNLGAALGDGIALHLGASGSMRAPTLFELPVNAAPPGGYNIERGSLLEAALDYDDGRRVRFGATLYRQFLTGITTRTLNGVGASLVWQIAPRLTLRAWTLHDSSLDLVPVTFLPAYEAIEGTALSRGVVWATYEAPAGIRIDGIVHREIGLPFETNSVDGDVVVPLSRVTALTAGTAARASSRRLYIGIRFASS